MAALHASLQAAPPTLLTESSLTLLLCVFRCTVAVFAVTALVVGRSYAKSVGGLSIPTIATALCKNLQDLFRPKGLVSECAHACM